MKYLVLALLAVYTIIYISFHIRLQGLPWIGVYIATGLAAGYYCYLSSKKKIWFGIGFFTGVYGVILLLLIKGAGVLKRKLTK